MKCQVCQTRAATVHYTDLSEGLKSYHLCEECYAMQKPQGSDMIGMLASALSPSVKPAEDPAAQVCGQCGLTYAAFRSRGRLGCPLCYDAFRPHLEPLLEKIHGGKAHMGKAPVEGATRERSRERLLISLRRKLQEAVQQENYELAASLRDELRRAEEGGETP
jgi:protein arginine kinase activator